MSNQQGLGRFRPKLISIAVASCFVTSTALANPTGHSVAHGNVTVKEVGNLLKIHNSPNAVINWRSFSIGADEVTRFIQESRNSRVMNRVIGSDGAIDPSRILGALKSNGQVYLLNPSGVVFGAGSTVDVAGLVATSLKLSDSDFQANRLKFTGGAGAGSVVNQGSIKTRRGGEVYLVGPAVTNSGIITSPNGNVVLAAGNQVELVNPGTPSLRVEISAPDNQAVNLGSIVAESGRIGIYAGLINNSGTIRADSAVAEGGRILLKAKQSVTLESGSVLDASGVGGGTIEVLASKSDGTVNVAGRLDSSAPVNGNGGFVETSAATVNIADGTVVTTSAARGQTGLWVIDPGDFVVASYGGNVTGSQVSSNLAETDIRLETTAAGGDLTVNDSISWGNSNSLTLLAHNNVNVNQSIFNEGDGAIRMYAGWNGSSPSSPAVVNGTGSIFLDSSVRTAGNMSLIAGNQISQNSSGVLGANTLLVKAGPGGVFLSSAINDVGTIAGSAGNSFYFQNGRTLTVGTVQGPDGNNVSGISVNGSSARVNLYVSGNELSHLNVNQDITANAAYGGAQIYLQASGSYGGDINVRNATLRAMGDGVEGNYVELYGRTVRIENSTVRAAGESASLNIYAYGPGGVDIDGSILEAKAAAASAYGGSATVSIASGVAGGNVLVNNSTVTATGRSAGALLYSYGGSVTVKSSTVTATGQTGADGGAGFVGILAFNQIDTSGSTLRATGKNFEPPKDVAVTAVESEGGNGIGLFASEGDITLGFLSSNGVVAVQTPGKIIDGNNGANIAAPTAILFGAGGVGSLDNLLETDVSSLAVVAESGQVGIVNSGDLQLIGLAFTGTDAAIGTTGTLTLGSTISMPGNLYLLSNNGMEIRRHVAVGGDLFMSSGAGDLGIYGVSVSGHNVELEGRSIFIGSNTGTAPTSVTASHLVKATTALNFNVIGGANSSAPSVVRGENVELTVGGVVNISGGSAYAQIESTSPTTITLTFPNRASGGFFVNGDENVISDGDTGFFAAGQPAVLGEGLKVTYGVTPTNDAVDANVDSIIASINKTGDVNNIGGLTQTDPGAPDEKDGKSLPVCN